jgi:hypothetical protein
MRGCGNDGRDDASGGWDSERELVGRDVRTDRIRITKELGSCVWGEGCVRCMDGWDEEGTNTWA